MEAYRWTMNLKNQNKHLLFAHGRAALAQLAKNQKRFMKILPATRTPHWKCQKCGTSANATACHGRGK